MLMDLSFYRGKKVFLTGHTGFKGTWLCRLLLQAEASVTGYALAPEEGTNGFFAQSRVETGLKHSIYGDIRDFEALHRAVTDAKPDIVFHLAAQPLVRESYELPLYTYDTNVMGTVHLLEAVRKTSKIKSLVNVTTDKVYRNNEWAWGYRETDILDGHDPYSNSKSCSELVTQGYRRSFFQNTDSTAISTARAGNVIGGGDFSKDRILPDCVRAAISGQTIWVRNPHSVRPYQHVLEPLCAYLLIAQRQWENPTLASSYNVGPEDRDCVTTGRLAEIFCTQWGEGSAWETPGPASGPHEAGFLKLDCSNIKQQLGWQPVWTVEEAVSKAVDWYKAQRDGADIPTIMDAQIAEYIERAREGHV